jgi:uncharacterized LabA/DUF88 family protein
VDGENFRHNIVQLFPQFQPENYLPYATWSNLFDWLVNEVMVDGHVSTDGQRIRTYWYVIKMVDFFPYNLPDPEQIMGNDDKTNKLRAILSKNDSWDAELETLELDKEVSREDRDAKMIEMLELLRSNQVEMESRFKGWISKQDGISLNYKGIEFRRAGAIKCDLFTMRLGSEKAVDVKLAADLITLKDIYDIAIIVSGDQDYVPAVEEIKDSGKWVVNVAFLTRSGKLLPGGARRLNQITDWHYSVPFDRFASFLNL